MLQSLVDAEIAPLASLHKILNRIGIHSIQSTQIH